MVHGRSTKRRLERGDPAYLCFCGIANFKRFKLGFDREFFVGTCALAGTHLIAVPTALRTAYARVAETVAPTRTLENGLFVAYANLAGHEGAWQYCGLNCIAGPDGATLARAGAGEEIIAAEIDLGRIARARAHIPYLGDRRPELYA